jgi:hypothetical protein
MDQDRQERLVRNGTRHYFLGRRLDKEDDFFKSVVGNPSWLDIKVRSLQTAVPMTISADPDRGKLSAMGMGQLYQV